MTDQKRTSQSSSAWYRCKIDNGLVLHSCSLCSGYKFPRCNETGEFIKYPVSGPVGLMCPREDYIFD